MTAAMVAAVSVAVAAVLVAQGLTLQEQEAQVAQGPRAVSLALPLPAQ